MSKVRLTLRLLTFDFKTYINPLKSVFLNKNSNSNKAPANKIKLLYFSS